MSGGASVNEGVVAELAARFYQASSRFTVFGLAYDWIQLPRVEQQAWLGMARVAVRHLDRALGVPGV